MNKKIGDATADAVAGVKTYWLEDSLEPRAGYVVETNGNKYKPLGCSPRVGDWVRVAGVDTLVLDVNSDGFCDAFPFFNIRALVGDTVLIVGPVSLPTGDCPQSPPKSAL